MSNPQGQHRLLFEHKGAAQPGEWINLECKPLLGLREQFRATGAERVDGIDYSAFKIKNVFVGASAQWYAMTICEPWPAADLFEKWDLPMDAAPSAMPITIQFINTSDKPQPFAVKLVGQLLR